MDGVLFGSVDLEYECRIESIIAALIYFARLQSSII